MANRKSPVSVQIDPEVYERLKDAKGRTGMSVVQIVHRLVDSRMSLAEFVKKFAK